EKQLAELSRKMGNVSSSGPAQDSGLLGGAGNGRVDESKLRMLTEQWGAMPERERVQILSDLKHGLPARHRAGIDEYFNALSTTRAEKSDGGRYLEEARKQLFSGLELGRTVQSVAEASALGDYFQYAIDRPVELARQKSALLPIVNKDVEGKRVSIYNPAVQPKHPLLGIKFKNTSGMPLTQGPVTVFEGSVYAGDARLLDLQPDEERLISYAIDLGTEVAMKSGKNSSRITHVKAV